jgi:hypothetical protein
VSDDPKPHSGSRWEPTPDEPETAVGSDDTGPDDTARPDRAADQTGETATPATADTPTEAISAAVEPGAGEPGRQLGWRRPVLLAAAAVGLVIGSGLGGFMIGQATANGPTRIGLVGDAGDYGTHRGGPFGPGGARGEGFTPRGGNPAPDDTGTQSPGTGADGTSTST